MATEDSNQLPHHVKDRRATAGGHGRKGKQTTEYRCYRPSQNCYEIYGGRGIVICDWWRKSFVNFFEDMGNKPSNAHSIDRIDGDGNYSCGHCEQCVLNGWTANCRWATPQEQMDNSKRSTMLTHDGITLSIRCWAKRLGITHAGIGYRMKQGWSISEIVEHFSH